MANTYTQIDIHLVFSPKNRESLIKKSWKTELEKYINGLVQNKGHKMLAISSMPDHIHIFFGYNVIQPIPDLVEEIKTSSSAWIKYNIKPRNRFYWQKGYGAFSHSRSQRDTVIKYILSQEDHHKKETFKTEYMNMLKKNDVKYDAKYLFDFFEDQIFNNDSKP